jgi:hypothetical protein
MAAAHAVPVPAGEAQSKLVAQYCAGCHSEKGKAGGLTLVGFDAAKADKNAEVAEKMIRKLRAGMMPPPGARRPDAATIGAFVDSLETKIDNAAAVNPDPGWRPFQRLNRAEYSRAGARPARPAGRCQLVPAARHDQQRLRQHRDVQTFSPTLMEGYLRAASQISRLAVGDRNASATVGHLQDRPHRVADAARRRHADGDARRHLGHARVPRPTATT